MQIMVEDSLPPPPGWLFCGCTSRSPQVAAPRSAKYGATHGGHHLRGGENVRLWSSFPPVAEGLKLRCARIRGLRAGIKKEKVRSGVEHTFSH